MEQTLIDKLWSRHEVAVTEDGTSLLAVDLHLIHEVSSPQAFEGLRTRGRAVRRPDLTLATMDHAIPTSSRLLPIRDPAAAAQVATLRRNCEESGVPLFDLTSPRQGIVHMIGPELGVTQPGMMIVCGDSHTPTHGAFGTLAVGVGTSDVEHVLATQCLLLDKPRQMLVRLTGQLPTGVTAKDAILQLIARLGVDGAAGHAVEFVGEGIDAMSMEARMTLCNMANECGARTAVIAPDDVTAEYLRGRELAPSEAVWEEAWAAWRLLHSDLGASFDKTVELDLATVEPTVTWGTTPAMAVTVSGRVPLPEETSDHAATRSALEYMGLEGGEAIDEIALDRVFIGSCTNARLEDLRAAAAVVRGARVHPRVRAMVVPGSMMVRRAAESEGLDRVFLDAGFEWREPGCSMCLGMNDDVLQPGERCASTSNRNFRGRQGEGGRTHLVSPAMAAAAAVAGHFVDVRGVPASVPTEAVSR